MLKFFITTPPPPKKKECQTKKESNKKVTHHFSFVREAVFKMNTGGEEKMPFTL
jgi:hypothetical protein